MKKLTNAELAQMIQEQNDTLIKMFDLFDSRLKALENAPTKSVASKPNTARKSKTSEEPSPVGVVGKASGITACAEPKWLLNKKCVYSAPNEFISKKARYAFKMQAQENGGSTLSAEQREVLVKVTKDKYTTAMVFKTEKDAKSFYTKWMQA